MEVTVTVNTDDNPAVTCNPNPVPATKGTSTNIQWNIPSGYTYFQLNDLPSNVFSNPSHGQSNVSVTDNGTEGTYPYDLVLKDSAGHQYHSKPNTRGTGGGSTIRNN